MNKGDQDHDEKTAAKTAEPYTNTYTHIIDIYKHKWHQMYIFWRVERKSVSG